MAMGKPQAKTQTQRKSQKSQKPQKRVQKNLKAQKKLLGKRLKSQKPQKKVQKNQKVKKELIEIDVPDVCLREDGRPSWLPKDWTIETRRKGGALRRFYVSPEGVHCHHKAKVEVHVGRHLEPEKTTVPDGWKIQKLVYKNGDSRYVVIDPQGKIYYNMSEGKCAMNQQKATSDEAEATSKPQATAQTQRQVKKNARKSQKSQKQQKKVQKNLKAQKQLLTPSWLPEDWTVKNYWSGGSLRKMFVSPEGAHCYHKAMVETHLGTKFEPETTTIPDGWKIQKLVYKNGNRRNVVIDPQGKTYYDMRAGKFAMSRQLALSNNVEKAEPKVKVEMPSIPAEKTVPGTVSRTESSEQDCASP